MKSMKEIHKCWRWDRCLCMIMLALACTGCNTDSEEFIPEGGGVPGGGNQPDETGVYLEVMASKKGSLLTSATWSDYNTMGLFVTAGTLDKPYLDDKKVYSNVKATMKAGVWYLDPAEVLLTDQKAVIFAYSPYMREVNPYEVPVETDTRTLYMYGTHLKPQVSVYNEENLATLELQHAMAVVDINVRKTSSFKGKAILNEISIEGINDSIRLPVKGTLDIMTGHIRTSGFGSYSFKNLKQVLPVEFSDSCAYRMTAIPRDNQEKEVKICIDVNGNRMQLPLSADQDWVAGVLNTYNLIFDGTDLIVESVTIKPYKDVEVKDGELNEREGK